MPKSIIFLFLSFSATCYGQVANKQSLAASNTMLFLENKGQVLDFDNQPRPDILYMLKGGGVNVFVGKGELHYLFSQKKQNPEEAKKQGFGETLADKREELDLLKGNHLDTTPIEIETYRLDFALEGMNPAATVEALEPNAYYENYYNIPGHYQDGILNVHSFGRIVMHNVYPHIDWVLYTKNGKLKHEFILHPGADFKDIKLRIQGAEAVAVNELGELEISTPLGSIVEDKPEILSAYNITGRFFVISNAFKEHMVEYQLNGIPEDFGSDIIIDPGVVWSTFYGGKGGEEGTCIVETINESIVGAGSTEASSGLSINGYQNVNKGGMDILLFKLNAIGYPEWITYFGGSKDEEAFAIDVNDSGDIVVVGRTLSAGLGFHSSDTIFYNGTVSDGIIVYFNNSGIRKWCGYSNEIATSGAYLQSFQGVEDGIFGCYNSKGVKLYGSYFGGSGDDNIMTLDNFDKYIYFSGITNSTTGISSNGFQNSMAGVYDSYIAKFDTSFSLIWSTYYGGTGVDFVKSLDINSGGIYGCGRTDGNNGIGKGTVFQSNSAGQKDAFVFRLSHDCKLIWGTYIGTTGDEDPRSITIDTKNQIWIITSVSPYQGLGYNGYYSKMTANFSTRTLVFLLDTTGNRIYSTYYFGSVGYPSSGNLLYQSQVLSSGKNGYVYECLTAIDTLPKTVRCKTQNKFGGYEDMFIIKWSLNNFSKPYLANKGNICQNTKLNAVYTQYGVGRGSTAKTFLELSDTSGKFNANTTTIFTRNDTLSQYDSVFYTIPYTVKPGKNYRIRARMVFPPDTSEASEAFEIHAGPTGQILTPLTTTFCERDSVKLELDTIGKNKLRWYRINSPTANAADTNRIFWAKLGGKHFVQLTNSWGCTYNTNSFNFVVNARPYAGFTQNQLAQCSKNNQFNFSDSSKPGANDNIISRGWNFADGNTGSGINTSNQYATFGTYRVKLGVGTTKGCKDTAIKIIRVYASPIAKIATPKLKACIFNNQFTLTDSTDLGEGSIAQRQWYDNAVYFDSQKIQSKQFTITGNHTIKMRVSSENGCTDSSSIDIKIYSSPVAVITSSKSEFCQGDSAKLTVTDDPNWTYQWKRNNSPLATRTTKQWHTNQDGNYTVRVTTPEGCDTVSNSLVITVNPLPKPNLGPDQTLPNNGGSTLNPGSFSNYFWSKGNNNPTQLVDKTNLDTGKNLIWVKVTDAKGCESSDSIIVTLLAPNIGILNPNLAGIKVYPVPMKQTLHIELPISANSNGIYTLSDMQGRIVLKGILKSQTAVDVASLAAGVYLLVIELDGVRFGVSVER